MNTLLSVLVVDDSRMMVSILRNLLQQIGFDAIESAHDGLTALTKLRTGKRYGLVISDWNMEPMSGYDLLCEMRRDEALKRTPFIMITGEAKPEHVVAARKAGVSNYIVKPFNAQTLKAKIEAALSIRRDASPLPA